LPFFLDWQAKRLPYNRIAPRHVDMFT